MLLTGFAQLQTPAIRKLEVVPKMPFVTFKEYYPSVWGSNLTVLASPVKELLRQVWTPLIPTESVVPAYTPWDELQECKKAFPTTFVEEENSILHVFTELRTTEHAGNNQLTLQLCTTATYPHSSVMELHTTSSIEVHSM